MDVIEDLTIISLDSSCISGELSVLAMIHVQKNYEKGQKALTMF